MNKKILALVVGFLVLVGLVTGGILFYQKYQTDKKAKLEKELLEKEKTDITKKSESFAATWDTYDYTTYPDKYTSNLRPYLTTTFYRSFTDQKKSMGFAKSIDSIKKTETVGTTRLIRFLSVEKIRDEYFVRVLVESSTTSKSSTTKKEKTLRFTWSKESGQYKVSAVEYEFGQNNSNQ